MNKYCSAVLLTLSHRTIQGGVEVYSHFLQRAFPALTILGQEDIFQNQSIAIPFLREPLVGKHLAEIVIEKPSLPEIVFTSGMQGWALPSREKKIPTISIMHGTFAGLAENGFRRSPLQYWRMRHIFTFFEKRSAQNAHVCIANSAHTQRELKKFYNVESRVIYPPIDTTLFKPGSQKAARKKLEWKHNEKKHVLFVGNPTESKGWDILLALTERHSEIIFHTITIPHTPSVRENIVSHPPQSRENLVHFFRAADALIFPSRYEGFGFVPLEALASGCPVVSSRVGIFHEFTPKNAVITRTHSLDAFDTSLSDILEQKPRTNDYDKITKKFSFKQFSEKILQTVAEAKKYNNSHMKESKLSQRMYNNE